MVHPHFYLVKKPLSSFKNNFKFFLSKKILSARLSLVVHCTSTVYSVWFFQKIQNRIISVRSTTGDEYSSPTKIVLSSIL